MKPFSSLKNNEIAATQYTNTVTVQVINLTVTANVTYQAEDKRSRGIVLF